MKKINIVAWQPYPYDILLGRRGENGVTKIVFDITSLIKSYGNGTATILAKRFEETAAYPVSVTQEGNVVEWIITDVDTAIAGEGKCELFYYVDEQLAKSIIYNTVVEEDIGDTTEDPPDAYESWVESLAELGTATETNAIAAAQSAALAREAVGHYPKIVDGVWYVWDADAGVFVSTDIAATGPKGETGDRGETGNGIDSAIMNDDYTLTINFTDGTEYTTPSIRGAQGNQGEQGPQGETGETGEKGEKGDTYELTRDDINEIAEIVYSRMPTAPIQHYGVRWNKVTAQMERTGYAATITTDTSRFCHSGSISEDYYNPFDSIYPWAGCKLCNIDMNLYLELSPGDSVTDCVVAWEDDPDFSYEHRNGVWKYRPEFWGKSWDEGGYRYFDITDKSVGGYVHYPAAITARWRGVAESRSIGGEVKPVLLSSVGIPCVDTAMDTIHTYANNWGATLDSVYSLDGSLLMMIIEYATMNMQDAIGLGITDLFRQERGDTFVSASSGATVHVSAEAVDYVVPNAIMDIGTSVGGRQTGRYVIKSVTYSGAGTVLDVTLDRSVTVSTGNYWSIHGAANAADAEIGSMSGYIGTNGKSECYYRGEALWGNMVYYVLGAYHEASTNRIWLAKSDVAADSYDAINKTAHTDTGVAVTGTAGYIGALGYLGTSTSLSAPALCTTVSGSSSNPVGDSHTNNASSNTVLCVGGNASSGTGAGPFSWSWAYSSGHSSILYSGRPRLIVRKE
jgi:hypothetical protein